MQTTTTKKQKYDIISESRSAQPLRFVADDTQKEKEKEGIIHIQIQEVPRRESTRNA